MLGETYMRVKLRENEYEILGPYQSEAHALADLKKRPRSHLLPGGSVEAELLIATKAYQMAKDGRLHVLGTLTDASTALAGDHEEDGGVSLLGG